MSFTHCFFINKQKLTPRKTSIQRDKTKTPVSGINTVFWSSSSIKEYWKKRVRGTYLSFVCECVNGGLDWEEWAKGHEDIVSEMPIVAAQVVHLRTLKAPDNNIQLAPWQGIRVHCLTFCLACCCCPQEVKNDADLAIRRNNTIT